MKRKVLIIAIMTIIFMISCSITSLALEAQTIDVYTGDEDNKKPNPYTEGIWFDENNKLINIIISGRTVWHDVWKGEDFPSSYIAAFGKEASARIYCTAHNKPIWTIKDNLETTVEVKPKDGESNTEYYKQRIVYKSEERNVEGYFDKNGKYYLDRGNIEGLQTLQGVGYILSAMKNRINDPVADQAIQRALWRIKHNEAHGGTNPDEGSKPSPDGNVMTDDWTYSGALLEKIFNGVSKLISVNPINDISEVIGIGNDNFQEGASGRYKTKIDDESDSWQGIIRDREKGDYLLQEYYEKAKEAIDNLNVRRTKSYIDNLEKRELTKSQIKDLKNMQEVKDLGIEDLDSKLSVFEKDAGKPVIDKDLKKIFTFTLGSEKGNNKLSKEEQQQKEDLYKKVLNKGLTQEVNNQITKEDIVLIKSILKKIGFPEIEFPEVLGADKLKDKLKNYEDELDKYEYGLRDELTEESIELRERLIKVLNKMSLADVRTNVEILNFKYGNEIKEKVKELQKLDSNTDEYSKKRKEIEEYITGTVNEDKEVKYLEKQCYEVFCEYRFDSIEFISEIEDIQGIYNSILMSLGDIRGIQGYLNQLQTMLDGWNKIENPDEDLKRLKDVVGEVIKLKEKLYDENGNLIANEEQKKGIFDEFIKKLAGYTGVNINDVDDVMDEILSNVNISLTKHADVVQKEADSLVTEAREYVNFYLNYRDKFGTEENPGEIRKETKIVYDEAKVAIDRSDKKYTIGPFTANYVYYAIDSKAEGSVQYWSAIKNMEIWDYNKQYKLGTTEYDETSKKMLIKDNKGNIIGELKIDKSERDPNSFDYDYQYPLGTIGKYGNRNISEKFYVEIKSDKEINGISIKMNMEAQTKCEGTFQLLKDVSTYWCEYEEVIYDDDGNRTDTVKKKKDSGIKQEVQALIAIDGERANVERRKEPYEGWGEYHKDKKEPKKWQFVLQKEDFDDGFLLPGAVFSIFLEENGEDTEAYREITDKSGRITLPARDVEILDGTDHEHVKIVIFENEAPKDYELDEKNRMYVVDFDINSDGRIINQKIIGQGGKETKYSELTSPEYITVDEDSSNILRTKVNCVIKNEEETRRPKTEKIITGYNLELIKVDGKNYSTLEGAKFKVTISNDKGQSKEYEDVTWSNGEFTIPDIRMDGIITVTIKEEEAPEGYEIIEDDIIVEFTAKRDVKNYKYKEDDTITKRTVIRYYIDKDKGINVTSGNGYIVSKSVNTKGNNFCINIKNNPPGESIKTTMNLGGYTFIDGANEKANDADGKLTVDSQMVEKLEEYVKKNSLTDEDVEILDGLIKGSDKLTSGVEVILYSKQHNENDYKEETRTVSEKGKYLFTNLNPMKDYKVEFIYNGQIYEGVNPDLTPSLYNSVDWSITSKGKESEKSRTDENQRFSEIGSDPVAYKVSKVLFKDDDYLAVNTNKKEDGRSYNKAYPQKDVADIYALVQDEMIKNKGKTIEVVYDILLRDPDVNTITDIKNKLQFIYDCRVSAYTENAKVLLKDNNSQGIETNYPVYDQFIIDEGLAIKTYFDGKQEELELNGYKWISVDNVYKELEENGPQYKTIYPGQYFVNMGIKERPTFNLSLTEKSAIQATVKINGKTETYKYKKETGLQLYQGDIEKQLAVRNEDIELNKGTTTYGKVDDSDKLQIYVKYGIQITNKSSVIGAVTEVVDYFDNRYEFDNNCEVTYKKKGENESHPISADKISSIYGTESHKNETDDYNGYTAIYLPITEDIRLQNEESLYVYITLKLKDDVITGNGIKGLQKYFEDEGKLETYNYAEINGYKTYGHQDSEDKDTSLGLVDINSIAGNFSVRYFEEMYNSSDSSYSKECSEIEQRYQREEIVYAKKEELKSVLYEKYFEDDNKRAEAFAIYSKSPRTLSGNVWDVTGQDGIKNSSEIKELKEYTSTKGVKGIKVQLVELKNGNEIPRMTDTTESDGSYKFENYIPGNYVVRFIYGDGETIQYNGQDYQSTLANDKTNDQQYWYAMKQDGNIAKIPNEADAPRYSDAYDEVQSRLDAVSYLERYGNTKGSIINSAKQDDVDVDYAEYEKYAEYKKYEDLMNALTMTANTSTLELEVEYAKTSTTGSAGSSTIDEDHPYEINHVDFGIIQRAESKLTIDKKVLSYKVMTQNQDENDEPLIYVNTEDSSKNVNKFVKTLPDGNISIEIDDEILHGAQLEVTYKITVKNEGNENNIIAYYFESEDQRDEYNDALAIYQKTLEDERLKQGNKDAVCAENKEYVGKLDDLYDKIVEQRKNAIAVGYYNEKGNQLVYYEGDKMLYHESDDSDPRSLSYKTYNDQRTYTLKGNDGKEEPNKVNAPITTRAINIVDYPLSTLNFAEKDKYGNVIVTKDKDGNVIGTNDQWTAVKINEEVIQKLNGDPYKTFNEGDGGKIQVGTTGETYQTILITNSKNELTKPLNIGETATTCLTLSKELSTTNDLEYENKIEIVEIENTAGRVDRTAIPGNLDPVDYDNTAEHDSSKAVLISIVDSTGEDKSNSYYIITIAAISVFSTGVVLIKKYVLKK